jgi:hypothetical protein
MIQISENRFRTVGDECALINADNPSERIHLQFAPQELASSRDAEVATINIIGRNLPIYHFIQGSRTLSLKLDFYTENGNGSDVLEKIRLIESWTFIEQFTKKAPTLFIRLGSNFTDSRWFIMPPIDVKRYDLDENNNLAPRRASVEFKLCQVSEKNLKQSEFRNGIY